jgi:hypothetical protein
MNILDRKGSFLKITVRKLVNKTRQAKQVGDSLAILPNSLKKTM